MFNLTEKRLAWIIVSWPGLVQRAPDALAEPVTHTIEMQVELLDQEQIDALNDRFKPLAGADDTPETRAQRRDIEITAMLELCHDWRGVADGTKSVPFDKANAARMIRVPGFSLGFNEAYAKALAGQVEEREKNSGASPEPGPKAAPGSDANP